MSTPRNKLRQFLLLAAILSIAIASPAYAFNLEINFNGGFTSSQAAVFDNAENFWENVITGYQPGISVRGIEIDAAGLAIDGVGGILGSAGPTLGQSQGGYMLATKGVMQFDTADISYLETNGTLYDVILHEMAHVIGFGTLWTYNGVYTTDSGQYTGAAALAAYQAEFDPLATYVPIELGGGSGTANAHWDEAILGDELMTGWLSGSTFVSLTTQYSFEDIGYTISPVPLPGAIVFFGSGLLYLLTYKRRQRRAG